MVDRIRGQELDVRHILLTPKVSQKQLDDSKDLLDTLRTRILDKEISFADAAFQFSSESETRFNGGVIINPATGDKRFELTKMDPKLYSQVKNLDEGEISLPLLETDRSGLKKFKIIMVSKRLEEHVANFSKDFTKIKDLALKDKQLETVKKWLALKIEETFVNVNKSFRACNFSNNWNKQ